MPNYSADDFLAPMVEAFESPWRLRQGLERLERLADMQGDHEHHDRAIKELSGRMGVMEKSQAEMSGAIVEVRATLSAISAQSTASSSAISTKLDTMAAIVDLMRTADITAAAKAEARAEVMADIEKRRDRFMRWPLALAGTVLVMVAGLCVYVAASFIRDTMEGFRYPPAGMTTSRTTERTTIENTEQ